MTRTPRLVGIAIATLMGTSACSGSSASPTTAPTHAAVTSTAEPAPTTSALPTGVLASIQMSGGPLRMAAGYGALWVASHDGNTLYRVDPKTNTVTARINVGTETCGAPALGLGRVWLSGCGPGPLSAVDPTTNKVVRTANVGTPLTMAIAAGKIWAGDPLDPVTLHRTARVPASADDVVAGAGSVWYPEGGNGVVKRVDETTAAVTRTYRAGDPDSLEAFSVFADGSLWIYASGTQLWRIDPATNRVTTYSLKGLAAGTNATFDVGDGAVWVRPNNGKLYRYDLTNFARTAYPADTGSGGFVTVAFGSIWESNIDTDSLWRVRE